MISTRAFVQLTRRMSFGSGDDAPFFGGIVRAARSRCQRRLTRRCLDRVIDFVTETQRRRLPAAAASSQRRVRIPSNCVGARVVAVVVTTISRQPKMSAARVLEPFEEAAFDGVV